MLLKRSFEDDGCAGATRNPIRSRTRGPASDIVGLRAVLRTSVVVAALASLCFGRISPVVAATYRLVDVHRAQADLADRQHIGKLVLVTD